MIKTWKGDTITWWNVIKPTEKDISLIKKEFSFRPVNLADIEVESKHPKIDRYQDYTFIVLLFPVYDQKSRTIAAIEVDFVIGNGYLMTVHNNRLSSLSALFEKQIAVSNPNAVLNDNFHSASSSAFLMHKILQELFLSLYPTIDLIITEIGLIEKNIFKGRQREMVEAILMCKRKIVNFRRIMLSHKSIIRTFISKDPSMQTDLAGRVYFEDLIDRAKEIWQILESQNEHISALHATNESLISFRLNSIMKMLTIFSVIVYPLTLIAGIFGMNTDHMPLVSRENGFWIILGFMSISSLFMFLFFKRKKWL